MKTAVQLIGGIPIGLLVALGAGWLLRRLFGQRPRPRLELMSSVTDVQTEVGDVGDPRRAKAHRILDVDAVFVPTYWAVFVALSALLVFRDETVSWDSWTLWVGIAAGLAATVTAISDLSENSRLRTVLDTPIAATTIGLVRSVRSASLVKWGGAAVTIGLLSALFTGDGRESLIGVLFWASVVVAGIGIAGLIWHPALNAFFVGMILVVAATLVYFAVDADGFLESFRIA